MQTIKQITCVVVAGRVVCEAGSHASLDGLNKDVYYIEIEVLYLKSSSIVQGKFYFTFYSFTNKGDKHILTLNIS